MSRPKRLWAWIAIAGLVVVAGLAITAEVMAHHADGILKDRITKTLAARFQSRVELDRVDASVLRGIEVSGEGLRIYPPDSAASGTAAPPLISIDHFGFHTGVLGLLATPTHVDTVTVSGLQINIPSWSQLHRDSANTQPSSSKPAKPHGKLAIVVDRIVCDNSHLIIGTDKPDKDPRDFELKHIELQNVGNSAPWQYQATLINAIPRGEIQAQGTFGPWQTESPGDSSVTGKYTFSHADLGTIHGIGGILSSTGQFAGQLNKIVIDGVTDTPDFSLSIAGHPEPLHTEFHAIVDGTTGDTYLQPVKARLRNSNFTTSGAVIDIKGKGHQIDLDIDVPGDRLQDFLELAVNTRPPVMTAAIRTKAKLHIRPGKQDVIAKLTLNGRFGLENIHFTNPAVQDKVDMMSLRAQGRPKEARPGAPDVKSRMQGSFALNAGAIKLTGLVYTMPGAQATLAGVYTLDGQEFDFHGKVDTSVPLSQMVDSRLASIALRVVGPLFRKPGQGQGAEIPFSLSGTKSAPKFGLDVLRRNDPSRKNNRP